MKNNVGLSLKGHMDCGRDETLAYDNIYRIVSWVCRAYMATTDEIEYIIAGIVHTNGVLFTWEKENNFTWKRYTEERQYTNHGKNDNNSRMIRKKVTGSTHWFPVLKSGSNNCPTWQAMMVTRNTYTDPDFFKTLSKRCWRVQGRRSKLR